MSWLEPVTLTGTHVTLAPLSIDHADELIEAVTDGELWTLWYTNVPRPDKIAAEIERRLSLQKIGSWLPFAVIENATGKAAGMTNYLNVDAIHRRIEIGATWYRKSVQRSAINTEAKLMLLRHAFEQLNCIAVEFRTHFFNRQSRRAIERLGARLDGILRSHQIAPDGTLRDTCVYSITAYDLARGTVAPHRRIGAAAPLSLGRWPRRHGAVPAFQVGQMVERQHLGARSEIVGYQRGDIGDAVGVAGHELLFRQTRVEQLEELGRPRLAPRREFRDLLVTVLACDGAALHPRRRVAERIGNRGHAFELAMALPFLDRAHLVGIAPEQTRLGMYRLEIAADRDGLGDAAAVVELQHRHGGERIDGEKFGLELFGLAQIDLHHRHFDAFLGEKDADAARVRRQREFIELHGSRLRNMVFCRQRTDA